MITISIKRQFTKKDLAGHIQEGFDVDEYVSHKRLMKAITKKHLRAFGVQFMNSMADYGEETNGFYDDMEDTIDRIREEIRLKLFP